LDLVEQEQYHIQQMLMVQMVLQVPLPLLVEPQLQQVVVVADQEDLDMMQREVRVVLEAAVVGQKQEQVILAGLEHKHHNQ
jgi:hypothetical protein